MKKERSDIHVLVADQQEEVLDFFASSLGSSGFKVKGTTRVKELLNEVGNGWPDIVVLDIKLPVGMLDDILPHIQTTGENLPLITLTDDDSSDLAYQTRVQSPPVFFYALKPLDKKEISEVIKAAAQKVKKDRSKVEAVAVRKKIRSGILQSLVDTREQVETFHEKPAAEETRSNRPPFIDPAFLAGRTAKCMKDGVSYIVAETKTGPGVVVQSLFNWFGNVLLKE